MQRGTRALEIALACTAGVGSAAAGTGWDPASGAWGKSDPQAIRVMTWNVLDGIRTEEPKTEGGTQWAALARTVAAMKPDVLLLQEIGDNNCSGCVDSVAELETVLDLFVHGGTDPFLGGTVTSFVQAYDPSYDLPHVFVGTRTDGFNRNAILSRFPFADLNGDGRATIDDLPFTVADAYACGNSCGGGGIRGFMHAEIDLADGVYAGDLVVGNAHLRAGSSGADHTERVNAARNIAYHLDYLYNGAGTGIPDPNGKIGDVPPATHILDAATLIVAGGDWNEDEDTNGTQGPAEWIACAALCDPATDGTDRDRSDMTFDASVEFFTSDRTTQGGRKVDYIAWQDSIGVQQLSFVFNSASVPAGSHPPELVGFPVSPSFVSGAASDHFAVITDIAVPLVFGTFCNGFDGSSAACPCTNPGDPDSGCDIAQGTGGVSVSVLVQETSPANRATLQGEGFPLAGLPGVVVIRGTGLDPAAPVVFGDGLRCVSTPLVRLGGSVAIAGFSQNAFGHGAAAGPGTFYYQLWFRNTPAGYCTPDAFNLSSGRALIW